jgi:hypothetical protein
MIWVLRIIIALLWFVVVWLGVPYLLSFIGIPPPPDNLMKAVAGLIALLWLVGDYRYRWLDRGPPVT